MVEIKITENEAQNEYLLEPLQTFLGARYDNLSDEIKVIFPQREIDNQSTCVMIITNVKGDNDCVTVRHNEVFKLKSPMSHYKQVFIGFSFQKPDGYVKNTNIGLYYFRGAQNPDAIVPTTPIQRKKINLLLAEGFADVSWSKDNPAVLEFKNVDGEVVKKVSIETAGGGGSKIIVNGEVVEEFNADTKADKVETEESISNLKKEITNLGNVLLQSGAIYKGDTETAYTERVTANGENVLDGSKAVLKKVVGNTVAVDIGENGTFKNASFAGIESKNADGTETSTLSFPKTEIPAGTIFDFETKTISNTWAKHIFLGDNPASGNPAFELWTKGGSAPTGYQRWYSDGRFGVELYLKTEREKFSQAVCDRFPIIKSQTEYNSWKGGVAIVIGSVNTALNIIVPNNIAETITADTIRDLMRGAILLYPTTPENTQWYTTQSFTDEQKATNNEYTAYYKGTEKVLGNDGAEYGADNTLTQNYLFVKE